MNINVEVFGDWSTPSEESEFMDEETITTKQGKTFFYHQDNESYLKYGFVSTGNCKAPCPLYLICHSKLSNKVIKSSKLLWHIKINHPELKDKLLKFFERRKCDHEGEKRLLRTALSANSNTLKASYLVFHRIAKTNKPFTTGEELISLA